MSLQLKAHRRRMRTQASNNRGLLLSLGVGLVAITLIVLKLWTANGAQPNPNQSTEDTQRLVGELSRYPTVYSNANLPQYPDGEVTYLGNESQSVDQPIVIYVQARATIKATADYYHRQLKMAGWELNAGRSATTSEVISRVYTKNDQTYQLTITAAESNEPTNVIITWQAH